MPKTLLQVLLPDESRAAPAFGLQHYDPFTEDPDYAAARTIETVTELQNIDHLLDRDQHRLTILIEGEIEDPAYQNGALLHLERLMGHLERMREMLGESLARQGALAEMLRSIKAQRDAALEHRADVYEDLVRRVADAQECSEAEARDLLTLLSSTDEDVMQCDLCDLDMLLTIREIMTEVIEKIDLE